MAIGNLEAMLLVNPFGSRIEVDRIPEVVQEVEKSVLDEGMERCVKQYGHIKNYFSHQLCDHFRYMKIPVLTPSQIDVVLNNIINKFNYKRESYSNLGIYLNKLISASYSAGYNDFTLTTNDIEISGLAMGLHGHQKNIINLKVFGTLGSNTGYNSSYLNMELHGDVGYRTGGDLKFSTITLYENTGVGLGTSAEDCIFTIKKNEAKSLAVSSKKCTYIVSKFNKSMFEYTFHVPAAMPKECVFATEKKEVYEQLKQYVPENNQNKARLIDKNNGVLQEVRV